MKKLLRSQKCFKINPLFFDGIQKMVKIRLLFFIVLTLSISGNAFSQSTSELNDETNLQNTAGTFQFESPTGTVLFWKIDFIETLYPGIESRRAINHNTIWHYNDDMDIVIFAKNIITSSDFVPLESPYKRLKEY